MPKLSTRTQAAPLATHLFALHDHLLMRGLGPPPDKKSRGRRSAYRAANDTLEEHPTGSP